MNFSDNPSADIDEHLSKEEANDGREEWIEERLEETMKDSAVFQEFLKEVASEHLNDELHRRLIHPSRWYQSCGDYLYSKFKDYCKSWLGEQYDKRGNHD